MHEPEHFRIAAFMLKKPVTLTQLATKTGLSLDKVIDFFNACVITQLVERLKDQKLCGLPEENTHSSQKFDLLKSVLKRLTG